MTEEIKTDELAHSTVQVEADMFNYFMKTYNTELTNHINLVLKTIESMEEEFRISNFEELESLSEEEVEVAYTKWIPEYLNGLFDAIVVANVENVEDTAETKRDRLLRISRINTILSMLYKAPIKSKSYAMDNITFDTYTAIYKQMEHDHIETVKASGEFENVNEGDVSVELIDDNTVNDLSHAIIDALEANGDKVVQ